MWPRPSRGIVPRETVHDAPGRSSLAATLLAPPPARRRSQRSLGTTPRPGLCTEWAAALRWPDCWRNTTLAPSPLNPRTPHPQGVCSPRKSRPARDLPDASHCPNVLKSGVAPASRAQRARQPSAVVRRCDEPNSGVGATFVRKNSASCSENSGYSAHFRGAGPHASPGECCERRRAGGADVAKANHSPGDVCGPAPAPSARPALSEP